MHTTIQGSHEITPKKKITRAEVIDAYKNLIAQGTTNPDEVYMNHKATTLFLQWIRQEDALVEHDVEGMLRNNLSKSMLHFDAGFTDPSYLGDVLEWLMQDAGNIEKQPDNPERTETRRQVAEAIRKVRNILINNKT